MATERQIDQQWVETTRARFAEAASSGRRESGADKTGVPNNSASPATGDASLGRSAAAGDIPPPGGGALFWTAPSQTNLTVTHSRRLSNENLLVFAKAALSNCPGLDLKGAEAGRG